MILSNSKGVGIRLFAKHKPGEGSPSKILQFSEDRDYTAFNSTCISKLVTFWHLKFQTGGAEVWTRIKQALLLHSRSAAAFSVSRNRAAQCSLIFSDFPVGPPPGV